MVGIEFHGNFDLAAGNISIDRCDFVCADSRREHWRSSVLVKQMVEWEVNVMGKMEHVLRVVSVEDVSKIFV